MKLFSLLLLICLGILACSKDAELMQKYYPVVVTNPVSENDSTGATFSAEILNYGTDGILDFGFVLKGIGINLTISLKDSVDLDTFEMRCTEYADIDIRFKVNAYVKTARNLILANQVVYRSAGFLQP